MLLSFRVSNFLSIKEEQEFSFLLSGAARSGEREAGGGSWDPTVGTLAGIFGANASGKSNVLKALQFMQDAVGFSYTAWASRGTAPRNSFALDPRCAGEPSLFEATFQLDGVRYQYGFRLTGREVVGEWLYAYVTHRRQVWFERDISSPDPWYFGKSFVGRNKVIADLTGPPALFLSTAAANNHKLAAPVARFFAEQLSFAWPYDRPLRMKATRALAADDADWREVVSLMRFADLGIRNARIRRRQLNAEQSQRIQETARTLGSGLPADVYDADEAFEYAMNSVEFGHSAEHGGDPVYLPLEDESLGTQAWFALAGPILGALSEGAALAVDELDASLHPHLTAEILSIFRDPRRNPNQAQLLFTSHDTTLLGGLLGRRELTRDQVWFTEKKENGATVLYPLTDFSPRKEENLERGYLQGRYGAIPYLDSHILDEVTGQAGEGTDTRQEAGDPAGISNAEAP